MPQSRKPPLEDPDRDPRSTRSGDADLTAELLEDGQEEVFSRYEVEHGLIEHQSAAGGSGADRKR